MKKYTFLGLAVLALIPTVAQTVELTGKTIYISVLPAFAGLLLIFFGTAVCLPETGAQILRGVLTGSGLSGGMLALSLLFDRLTGKESLGGGDIKLFFVTGLYIRSIWEVLFFLILSCVLGIGCSLVWRKGKIPFGPAIAAAFFLMLLFGEQLTGWYRGLWLL